jgi:cytochrome c-type biogenesis protein CcmH/NrfG
MNGINNPDNATIYIQRGDVYEAMNMADLAYQDYRKIRRIAPKFHEAYVVYANDLDAGGNPTEANRVRIFISKLFSYWCSNFQILRKIQLK